MINLRTNAARQREALAQRRLIGNLTKAAAARFAGELHAQVMRAATVYEETASISSAEHVPVAMEGRMQRTLMASYDAAMSVMSSRVIVKGGKIRPGNVEIKDATAEVDAYIRKWAVQNSAKRIKEITKTTQAILRSTISKAAANGKSVAEVSRAIRKELGTTMPKWRGDLIARTEVHSAAQAGSLAGAESLRMPLQKEWIASSDDRTRDDHRDADGQAVDIKDMFNVGGSTLAHPGDPDGDAEQICNCRCAMVFNEPDHQLSDEE